MKGLTPLGGRRVDFAYLREVYEKPTGSLGAPPTTAIGHIHSNRSASLGARLSVDLLAHDCERSLIDLGGIPRLDGREIGFARLISRACLPAMGPQKICR